MPINILMPALSPTMEKGNLAKWLKKEGDKVKSGDILAEIETDKATMEVEAVDEGILAKIVVPAGTADVPVNELIALIAGERGRTRPASPPPRRLPPRRGRPTSSGGAKQVEDSAATKGGYGGTAQAADVQAASAQLAKAGAQAAAEPAGGRIFASPLAKRMAKEFGIDLSRVVGSGPHGRVIERDVKAAQGSGGAKQVSAAPAPQPAAARAPEVKEAPAPAPMPSGPSDDMVKRLFAPGSYTEIPHDGMRKTIARRLTEAKQTVPAFLSDARLQPRRAARPARADQRRRARGRRQAGLQALVNDLVIKAWAMALRAVPDANVSWTDSAMLKHAHVDVGVAVSIPGGLITPIIRDACHKTLSTISNEMKDLAARAKNRKLKPEEYQGGSTAVSNLGMFGVKDFAAVINPPHATILAVGAGEKRPVVKPDGSLGVANRHERHPLDRPTAPSTARWGGSRAAFKKYIENPMGMLV